MPKGKPAVDDATAGSLQYSFMQLLGGFFGGGIGAQFATEGTGEDGFFLPFDLFLKSPSEHNMQDGFRLTNRGNSGTL